MHEAQPSNWPQPRRRQTTRIGPREHARDGNRADYVDRWGHSGGRDSPEVHHHKHRRNHDHLHNHDDGVSWRGATDVQHYLHHVHYHRQSAPGPDNPHSRIDNSDDRAGSSFLVAIRGEAAFSRQIRSS
jgi:hypothetical protein